MNYLSVRISCCPQLGSQSFGSSRAFSDLKSWKPVWGSFIRIKRLPLKVMVDIPEKTNSQTNIHLPVVLLQNLYSLSSQIGCFAVWLDPWDFVFSPIYTTRATCRHFIFYFLFFGKYVHTESKRTQRKY